MRSAWQEHIGVGEAQPCDRIVTDGTRRHVRQVPHVDGGVAGTQTEHRSGRVDANVHVRTVEIGRDQAEGIREKSGLSRAEFKGTLDRMHGGKP